MADVELNGSRFYYDLQTPRADAPSRAPETVVFLNGIMMNTSSWAPHLGAFTENYQVLRHDFRGQGRSAHPDEPCTFDLHVEDLKALLDHLKLDKVHLVGTSYGSEIGQHFAVKYPDRVRSITIAAGVSETDALLRAKIKAWMIANDHAIRWGAKEDLYISTIPANFSAAYMTGREEFFAAQAKRVAALPESWFIALQRLCECFLSLNITSRLKTIRCPALVIAGDEDELKPLRFSKLVAESIPGAKFKIMHAGHALVLEKPEKFNNLVLEFLASLKPC